MISIQKKTCLSLFWKPHFIFDSIFFYIRCCKRGFNKGRAVASNRYYQFTNQACDFLCSFVTWYVLLFLSFCQFFVEWTSWVPRLRLRKSSLLEFPIRTVFEDHEHREHWNFLKGFYKLVLRYHFGALKFILRQPNLNHKKLFAWLEEKKKNVERENLKRERERKREK